MNSERQNNNNKIHKNTFLKSYKLICILMSEICFWPLLKTWPSTWRQKPCWKSQRSDVYCSWPPGLHTSQEGFCPTPLYRSSPSHWGFEANVWQLKPSAPSTDFLWNYGLQKHQGSNLLITFIYFLFHLNTAVHSLINFE